MSHRLYIIAFVIVLAQDAATARSNDCLATAIMETVPRDPGRIPYIFWSEMGVFADGYDISVTGELFHVHNGFNDFGCIPQWKSFPKKPWVALVRRGNCSVEAKIENALLANASGIIIYNIKDNLIVNKIKVTKKFRGLISVVFTYRSKGDKLVSLLETGASIMVALTVTSPCIPIDLDDDRKMQLLSVSCLCFLVFLISLAWLLFYYFQRYRDLQTKERNMLGYSEADEKALKEIPTKTIKTNDKLLNDDTECCAICIDPYRTSDVVRILACNHEFHKSCIDPWLLENRNCPMCKMDILRRYGSVFTGSQESILQVVADEAARDSDEPPPDVEVIIISNENEEHNGDSPAVTDENEMRNLMESAEPPSTDDPIAASTSSLKTVDSAHEALELEEEAPLDANSVNEIDNASICSTDVNKHKSTPEDIEPPQKETIENPT